MRWRNRALGMRNSIGRRFPGTAPALDRIDSYVRQAVNLRRWAAIDPRLQRRQLDLAVGLAEPPAEPLLHPGVRTLRRGPFQGTPSGVICSLATEDHIRLLSIALPTLYAYADRHGWDVAVSTEVGLADGRPASWAKLPFIKSLMDDYDLVWWIDADALIVDSTEDIRGCLRDGRDLYLVEHLFPNPAGFAPSAGVMLWRTGEWSRNLLDELWKNESWVDAYPWENAALLESLGYTVSPFFAHLHPTEKMDKVCYLDPKWNTVWSDPPCSEPRVHHHGGSTGLGERRILMLEDLARWRAGLTPVMTRPVHAPEAAPPAGFLGPLRPASVMTRDELPLLLNERGLVGQGVEVGVYAGEFSGRILSEWRGARLISVDPWRPHDAYLDVSNVGADAFELLWLTARRRLERHGARSEVWRMTGDEAAPRIDDGSLDFVYIDARHDETSVREDLRTWYPKLRPGGILAGHDYLDGELPEGVFGVKSAVDDFAAALGTPLHVTGEAQFPSWIIEVPKGSIQEAG